VIYRMNKSLNLALTLLSVLLLSSSTSCSSEAGSPDLWLSDFEKLKEELVTGYANLEWAARHDDLDIARLLSDTEEELRQTTSRRKARKIVSAFLQSFNDPHLRAEHSGPPSDSPTSGGQWIGPPNTASSKEALAAFGYRKAKYDFGVDFRALDGFTELEDSDNPFPAGILQFEDGRKLGVIRVKYFGEDRYYKVAARTWEEFRGGLEGTCDQSCWWTFTLQVRTHLMEYLEARLDQLEGNGVGAVLVDLAGNGGGSEWCEDVAQLFATKTLRAPPAGFVKHDHWLREIERELDRITKDLAREDLTLELRVMLEEVRATHEDLLDVIQTDCNGSAIWTEGSVPECDRLVFDEHGQYVIPAGAESVATTLASEHILFKQSRHPDFVGLYDGPLFVLIDGGTASASEQFATLLQFNDAATVIGETSYGAGCGYTRGGIKVYLENLELRVWMPDCVRVRADGENELSGIDPDVPGWETGDSGKKRARALMESLRGMTM
jgi:hypothetical protein